MNLSNESILHSPMYQNPMSRDLLSSVFDFTSFIAWGLKNKVVFTNEEGVKISSIETIVKTLDEDCLIIKTDNVDFVNKLQEKYINLIKITNNDK